MVGVATEQHKGKYKMGLKKVGTSKSLQISTWRKAKWENTDALGREVIRHSSVYQAGPCCEQEEGINKTAVMDSSQQKGLRRDHFPSILARQNTFSIAPYKPAV